MSTAAVLRIARPAHRPRVPLRRIVVAAVLALLVFAAAYRFYLRDSALVAVSAVKVEGVDPALPGGAVLRADLENAAERMTTLHVQPELLERATADNPLVKSVSASAAFPHKLTVSVVERRPAAIVGSGQSAVVVAGDGVLLPSLPTADMKLPSLPGSDPPAGPRLSGNRLQAARILGAAPPAFTPYLDGAVFTGDGVSIQLTDGIELRFGDSSNAARKWAAAAGVLADPDLTVLDYVDLSAPNRPAVGGSGHTLAPAP